MWSSCRWRCKRTMWEGLLLRVKIGAPHDQPLLFSRDSRACPMSQQRNLALWKRWFTPPRIVNLKPGSCIGRIWMASERIAKCLRTAFSLTNHEERDRRAHSWHESALLVLPRQWLCIFYSRGKKKYTCMHRNNSTLQSPMYANHQIRESLMKAKMRKKQLL